MNTSIMTLDQIDALIKKGYHFYCRFPMYHWEGRVGEIVKNKHGQGFGIVCHGNIRASDKNFVVKTSKKTYEIHNSKTAYMRYLKEPKRQNLKINDIRYNEETDKVECWNGYFWATL
jgi:hypothetical protein